ncbi:NADP-dependent oxidoreductase [Pseudomonas sp. WHRI 8519]|uniref:NADP-dependent oxidoreductase n=1 Tax=Pseudomonas sp. WHRI 8519 TaxID=3162567 RepID=UPI0032EAF565
MKALTFKRYGKSPDIGFTEVAKPSIKSDELLIEVYAVGLNPIDNMMPTGIFKEVLKFEVPATLGSDVAGVVVSVGSAVTKFKVGDEVFASVFDLGAGTLADFAAVPEFAAAHKLERLSFVQAASVPMVGLTSWQALRERANLVAGQKIFIPAGSGGIGTFAIQLAKYVGAWVATTTSAVNAGLVRSLGADEVIDDRSQKFENVLTSYDLVLGTVRGDELDRSIGIISAGGKIVSLVGPLDSAFAEKRGMSFIFNIIFSLMGWKTKRPARKRGVSYSFLFVRPDGVRLKEIATIIRAGSIKPVIDQVFAFEDVKEALTYLAQGRAKGKVVVQMK